MTHDFSSILDDLSDAKSSLIRALRTGVAVGLRQRLSDRLSTILGKLEALEADIQMSGKS